MYEHTSLDLSTAYGEVRSAYANVDKWCKPQGIGFHFNWFAMRPKLTPEPKGVILIIAPFNLPCFLLLSPLVRCPPSPPPPSFAPLCQVNLFC